MTENEEDFFEKCKTCKHCYTKQDDDYVYCRKLNGKCEYKPYKVKKHEAHNKDNRGE